MAEGVVVLDVTVPRVVVDMLARGVIIRASAVPSEARGATKKTRAVKARETIGAPAIAGALALALVASPLAARAEDANFGVDYDAATKQTYNVREQRAKKPAKEYKQFVAPTREAPEPKAKPAPKEGGGFSLPSFSLPSISLPSFGGDAAESTESSE